MEFRILGPLEVRVGGGTLGLGAAKQRALLGVLLLHANEAVSSGRLVEELWGERPPAAAAKLVQGYVSALRKPLGPDRIVTQRPGYLVRAEDGELDLHAFDRLVGRARGESPERAAGLLREADALWRGPALADLRLDGFAGREAERLNERRLAALLDRIDAELVLGRHADLVGELETLVAEHPLHERLSEQLMLALYRSGRQTEALDVYQRIRRTLADELGLEPGQPVRDLQQSILGHDAAIAGVMPVRPSEPSARVDLPAAQNSFVGRARELAEVCAELERDDVRLLTLTGPGGSGKTRLALQAAALRAGAFGDGVTFVSFARVTDAQLVAPTVARALGLSGNTVGAALDALRDHLGQRDVLLVLDNLEHLVAGTIVFHELLAACSRLQLIATSREPLRLAAEHEYPVPPLGERDAIELFRERARAVNRTFGGNGEISEICRRLDCLPLAIELAAARARSFPAAEILARLDARLPLLVGGPRDAPERQQTLRATIDWSYDLLGPLEQQLLAQLSVFAGGWTLEAAAAVAGADAAILQSLVDKSLVQVDSGRRFSLLETVHEYAGDRLEERGVDGTRMRHAEYFTGKARDFRRDRVAGRSTDGGLPWINQEQDNLRGALAFVSEIGAHESEATLLLALTVGHYALRGFMGGSRPLLEGVLGHPLPVAQRSEVLATLTMVAYSQNDLTGALEAGREAVALARPLGDPVALGRALNSYSEALSAVGELEEADRCLLELEGLARDDLAGLQNVALFNRGYIALLRHDTANARRLLEEALELTPGNAAGMQNLGLVALHEARTGEALEWFAATLRSAHEFGVAQMIVLAIEGIAAAIAGHDPFNAARLYAGADVERRRHGLTYEHIGYERELRERTDAAIDSALADDELAKARSEGSQLGLERTIAQALELAGEDPPAIPFVPTQ